MTILCSIHIWKRPEVTKVMFKGLRRIIDTAPPDVKVLPWVCYSTDADIDVIPSWVFRSIYAHNKPLGRKHNVSLRYALQYRWDYFMQLGSDDLLSKDFWDYVTPMLTNGRPFFGFQNLYVVDSATGYVKVHRNHAIFGAARFIHRDWMDKVAYVRKYRATREWVGVRGRYNAGDTYWLSDGIDHKHSTPTQERDVRLWDDNRNRGLDTNSEKNIVERLRVHGHSGLPVSVKAWTPCVLDIKTDHNLNAFADIPGADVSGQELHAVYGLFPEVVELIPMHKTPEQHSMM